MNSDAVFILLFVLATPVAIAVRRMRIPYTVALVLAGLVLGSLNALNPPHLTKELLFDVFLPGLIFEAAYHLRSEEFRANRYALLILAVPGVVVSMAITALVLAPLLALVHSPTQLGIADALLFGALISATDPLAVVSLFRSLGAPRR